MMNEGKHKRKIVTNDKIYRPNVALRILAGAVWMPFLACIFLAGILFAARSISIADRAGSTFILMGLLIFGPIVLLPKLYYLAFENRLIVWDTGLESYVYGVHSFTRWENIERFMWSTEGKQQVWGVYASHIERQEVSLLAKVGLAGKANNFIPLAHAVQIPTMHIIVKSVDMNRFKQTAFGQDLLHHARHLFSEGKQHRHG